MGGIQNLVEKDEGQFSDAEVKLEACDKSGKLNQSDKVSSSILEGGSGYEDETTSRTIKSPDESGRRSGRSSSPSNLKKQSESSQCDGEGIQEKNKHINPESATSKTEVLSLEQSLSRLPSKRSIRELEGRESDLDRTKILKISPDGGRDCPIETSTSSHTPEAIKAYGQHIQSSNVTPGQSFPEKLHLMLKAVEEASETSVVSWLDNGRGLAVFRKLSFNRMILKNFFQITIFESFHRLLIEHGFRRLTRGYDKDDYVYYHESFVRNRPDLCKNIQRVVGREEDPIDPESEPDLSKLPPTVPRSPSVRAPPPAIPFASPASCFVPRPMVVPPRPQYVDCAALPDPPRHQTQPGENFPEKIHKMLRQTELEGNTHICSFLGHGRAFAIIDKESFEGILGKFGFTEKTLDGFRSALFDFGFRKLAHNEGNEVFYHQLFLRGRPGLCVNMQTNGAANRAAGNHHDEPNLDAYPPMPPAFQKATQGSTSDTSLAPKPQASTTFVDSRYTKIAPRPPPTFVYPTPPKQAVAPPPMIPPARHPVTLYMDCATLPDPPKHRKHREPDDNFVEKLHKMLTQTELDGNAHIISFLPHGRSFAIHDCRALQESVLFRFGFPQKKIDSFLVEIASYGFKKIATPGPDEGSYYHELFLRTRPGLCANMQRNNVGQTQKQQHPDPKFAEYPPMPPMGYQNPAMPNVPILKVSSDLKNSSNNSPLAPKRALPVRDSNTQYADFAAWPDPPRQIQHDDYAFPAMLHRMLHQLFLEGKAWVISFLSHGRAFSIHDEAAFEHTILPRFFPHKGFKRFLELLVDHGFEQLTKGRDNGAFYHELFLRGRPGLCVNMQNNTKSKQPFNPECQPNFYDYPPLPPEGMIMPVAAVPPVPYGAFPYPYGPFPYPYPHPPPTPTSSTSDQNKSAKNSPRAAMPPYPYPYPPNPYRYPPMQRPAPTQQQPKSGGPKSPEDSSWQEALVVAEQATQALEETMRVQQQQGTTTKQQTVVPSNDTAPAAPKLPSRKMELEEDMPLVVAV